MLADPGDAGQGDGAPDGTPDGPAGEAPLLRLTIQGTPEAVSAALHALFTGPDCLPLPVDTGGDAQIVLAEAMNNIVEHAYADRVGQIDVTFWDTATGLVCRLVDNGAPLPDVLPEGQLPATEGDLPEGGFGWFLIRTIARDIVHRRAEGLNYLTFSIPRGQSRQGATITLAGEEIAANPS